MTGRLPALFSPAVLPPAVRERIAFLHGCWLWTGARDKDGYALWTFRTGVNRRRSVRLHRFTWTAIIGPIPDGLQVDHLCNVKNCIYPGHLRLATLQENLMAEHSMSSPKKLGMRTHCKHGHEFTPENTHMRADGGGRACRECGRLKVRRRRAMGLQ